MLPLLLALATFPMASDAATCGFVNWFSKTTNTVRLKMASDATSAAHTTSDLVAYKAVTYFTCPENPTANSLYVWAEDSTGTTTVSTKVLSAGAVTCDGANLFTYVPKLSTAGADPEVDYKVNTDASGNKKLVLSTGVTIFVLNYGEGTNTPVNIEVKTVGASSWRVLQNGVPGNFDSGAAVTSSNSAPYGAEEFRFKGNDGSILASGTTTKSASNNGLALYYALIGTFDSAGNAVTKEAVRATGCSSNACYTCGASSSSSSSSSSARPPLRPLFLLLYFLCLFQAFTVFHQ